MAAAASSRRFAGCSRPGRLAGWLGPIPHANAQRRSEPAHGRRFLCRQLQAVCPVSSDSREKDLRELTCSGTRKNGLLWGRICVFEVPGPIGPENVKMGKMKRAVFCCFLSLFRPFYSFLILSCPLLTEIVQVPNDVSHQTLHLHIRQSIAATGAWEKRDASSWRQGIGNRETIADFGLRIAD